MPDVLLKYQKGLGLNATDMLVLINLTMHWWYKDVRPFPRTSVIAKRMDVDVRTVQRSVNRLQKLGLVSKEKDRNQYGEEISVFDLSGLVQKLEVFAKSDPDYQYRMKVHEGNNGKFALL